MRGLCMVAHPDDCVIYGYRFMTKHSYIRWHICYATYTEDHERGREIAEFWKRRGITTSFLGLSEDKDCIREKRTGWDENSAFPLIHIQPYGYQIVLTHNHKGENFNPQHQTVHHAIRMAESPTVYFGSFPDFCNNLEVIDEPLFDLAELPLHRSEIEAHDLKMWKYYITPEAQVLLKSNDEINGES